MKGQSRYFSGKAEGLSRAGQELVDRDRKVKYIAVGTFKFSAYSGRICRFWRSKTGAISLVFGLLAVASSLLPVASQSALAQTPPKVSPVTTGTGSIGGKISNGTAGAAVFFTGQIVKLERVTDSNQATDESQVAAEADGNFLFQNLLIDDKYTYYISTFYNGVTYYVQNTLKLNSARPTQSVELKVYEVTNEATTVSVAGTSIVVPQVDMINGQIMVLEMYSLQNKSDRTFTKGSLKNEPTTTAASKVAEPSRQPTLRFFLPTGATGITPATGILPGDIVETSEGIEVSTPVLPGDSQMVFSYRLAYQGETFSFNKRLAYDTPSLRFFTPINGPKAVSSQLTAGQPMQMGQQQLATLSGQNLKAGTSLRLELSNLPLPPSQDTIATRDNILKITMLLFIPGSLAFIFFYVRRRSPVSAQLQVNQPGQAEASLSTGETETEVEQQRRRLLYKLARLDYDYEKGDFRGKEADYQRNREQWKAQLIEIWPTADVKYPESNSSQEAYRKVSKRS